MTLKEAQLIKRTAWQNMQPRKPTKEDEKYVPIAVQMLSYIGALDYALYDLEETLTTAGQFRHSTKRVVKQSQQLAMSVHAEAYHMFGQIDKSACRQYNDKADEAYARASECILLEGVSKSYNIVIALCRIIEKLNRSLSGRYDFAPARALYRIPSLLQCIGETDYQVDRIMEMNMQKTV